MKKILFLTLIAGALLFSASCQREGVIYDFPQDAALLSFPNNKLKIKMAPEDGGKFVVQLHRGNIKGALSVPFELTDKSGFFTPAKNTFDFADGEGVANVEITYPDVNDFGGETYKILLDIDEEQVSPSGFAGMTVAAQRLLTPVYLGEGEWLSSWFDGETHKQKIYNTKEVPNCYILENCWDSGVDFTFMMIDGEPVWPEEIETELPYDPDIPDYGNVSILPVESFFTEDDGKEVLVLICQYALPKISYVFGGTGVEAFYIPEDVVIE